MLRMQKSYKGGLITALLLLSCLFLPQSRVIAEARTGYENNPLLQKTITVNAVPIPLRSLCHMLGGNRITISASKEYSGQLLQMNIVEKPVWQVMKALATLLSGTWLHTENGDGYILEMRVSAIRQRRNWWKIYSALTQEIKKKVETNFVKELRNPTSHNVYGFERENLNPELTTPPDVIYGTGRINPEFFQQLGNKILNRISQHINFDESYDPIENYGFGGYAGNVIIPSSELSVHAEKILDSPGQYYGRKVNYSLKSSGSFIINFIIDINSINYEVIDHNLFSSGGAPTYFYTSPSLQAETMLLNPFFTPPASLPKNVVLPKLYLQLKAEETLPFPQLAVMKNVRKKVSNSVMYNYSSNSSFAWNSYINMMNTRLTQDVLRSDKLEWLAKVAGIQYISDYYSLPGVTVLGKDRLTYLPHPLDVELNQMAKVNQSSWGQENDGIVLVRDNMWYREDRLQPEQRKLDTMWAMVHIAEEKIKTAKSLRRVEIIKEKLEIALEDYIDKHFTPLQIEDGLQFYMLEPGDDGYAIPDPAYPLKPFAGIALGTFRNRPIIKLFFSLSPEEQNTFLTGKLPVSELTVKQREYAFKCFPNLLTMSPNSKQFQSMKISLSALLQGYSISEIGSSYNSSSNMAILPDYSFQLNEFPHQIWK